MARDYIAAIERGLQKDNVGAKLGKVFMMPASFPGSRQYYQEKYANLMTIVQKKGAPTWFITFTGNPVWPEIKAALAEGQEYTNRPDIVCRIFMDKAAEFIKDITERHILGNVGAWCYSVEHQKRGMPHIHMLVIMEKGHQITSPEQVDNYISARIPPLPPLEDQSVEADQQRRLWHLVTSCMLHDCNKACIEQMPNGRGFRCKKHFPKRFSNSTVLSSDRYAEYIRVSPINDDYRYTPDNDPDNSVSYRRIPPNRDIPTIDYENNGLIYYKRQKKVGAL